MISTVHQIFSGNKIELNEMGGACSGFLGEDRRIQGFGGKPEGKRQLGRLRRKWGENSKMDLQEEECRDMDRIELAQEMDSWQALVNAVMNFHVP